MDKKTLYHKDRKGGIRQWSVWSDKEYVFTEYGALDGKMQISKVKCVGKNIGKSNETTPEQQANLEAESSYLYKLERKYSTTIDKSKNQMLLPMLAKEYSEKKHNKEDISWYAQPKLDGVRCLAIKDRDGVRLLSRSGKPYDVQHIVNDLMLNLPDGVMLDGELYIHGMSLQQLISLVKKPQPKSIQIEYRVYDIIDNLHIEETQQKLPFKHRNNFLKLFFNLKNFSHTFMVKSEVIKNIETEITNYLESMLSFGYEGAILRHPEGIYQFGYRSNDLLKVKKFQDAEFEVVGFKEGEGKMEGHVIFVCKNDVNDETFDVVPKATMDERKQMYESGNNFIGKKYTVKFFDRTDAKVPRFGVGLAFQEDR